MLFDPSLVQTLPLPLAELYRAAHNADSAFKRHLIAYSLWEAALKLMTIGGIADYATVAEGDPQFAASLRDKLRKPSIGKWWELCRASLRRLAQHKHEAYVDYLELESQLLGPGKRPWPSLAGLNAVLAGKPSATTVRPHELFDHLINHRNKFFGHGAPATLPDSEHDRYARALMSGLTELFQKIDVLARRRLVYVSQVRRHESGSFVVERYALVGESMQLLEPWVLQSAALPVPKRLYLVGEEREERLLAESGIGLPESVAEVALASMCPLHPLVRFCNEKKRFEFWNEFDSDGCIEYLCYASNSRSTQKDKEGEFEKFLAKVSGKDKVTKLPPIDRALPRCSTEPIQIGGFDLVTKLGEGQFGRVYRARQPSLEREVALKRLNSTHRHSEERFAREIKALGRVEHPNLIRVYHSGSDGDLYFYVMELVEGADLYRVYRELGQAATMGREIEWANAVELASAARSAQETKCGQKSDTVVGDPAPQHCALDDVPSNGESDGHARLSRQASRATSGYCRRVATIIQQMASAAYALHQAGVVHRDIKPANILVTRDGEDAVLSDLGVARFIEEEVSVLTQERIFVGTKRYASPEQLRWSACVDHRADIYALGATMWEMLALRPLFEHQKGESESEFEQRIHTHEPPSIAKFRAGVPKDLERIARKCLEKDPGRRYSTAHDLADDLERWLRNEPIRARDPSLLYVLRKAIQRHPGFFVGVATAILLLATGLAWWVTSISKEKQREMIKSLLDRATDAERNGDFAAAMNAWKELYERSTGLNRAAAQIQHANSALDRAAAGVAVGDISGVPNLLGDAIKTLTTLGSTDIRISLWKARADYCHALYEFVGAKGAPTSQVLDRCKAAETELISIERRNGVESLRNQINFEQAKIRNLRGAFYLKDKNKNYVAAERQLNSALTLLQQVTADEAISGAALVLLEADVQYNLGLSIAADRPAETLGENVLQFFNRATELYERITLTHGDVPFFWERLAESRYRLGYVEYNRDNYEAAVKHFRDAYVACERANLSPEKRQPFAMATLVIAQYVEYERFDQFEQALNMVNEREAVLPLARQELSDEADFKMWRAREYMKNGDKSGAIEFGLDALEYLGQVIKLCEQYDRSGVDQYVQEVQTWKKEILNLNMDSMIQDRRGPGVNELRRRGIIP